MEKNERTSLCKELGWSVSQMDEVDHVITNTRDSQKHIILRMYLRYARPSFFGTIKSKDEYLIRVIDRRDFTARVTAEAVRYSRDEIMKLYVRMVKHWALPSCCDLHDKEVNPAEHSKFFQKQGGFFAGFVDTEAAFFRKSTGPTIKKKKKKKKSNFFGG